MPGPSSSTLRTDLVAVLGSSDEGDAAARVTRRVVGEVARPRRRRPAGVAARPGRPDTPRRVDLDAPVLAQSGAPRRARGRRGRPVVGSSSSRALVGAGQEQQVVDQALQPQVSASTVAGQLRGWSSLGVGQRHLGVLADRGDRRAQLVRGVATKLPLPALRRARAGSSISFMVAASRADLVVPPGVGHAPVQLGGRRSPPPRARIASTGASARPDQQPRRHADDERAASGRPMARQLDDELRSTRRPARVPRPTSTVRAPVRGRRCRGDHQERVVVDRAATTTVAASGPSSRSGREGRPRRRWRSAATTAPVAVEDLDEDVVRRRTTRSARAMPPRRAAGRDVRGPQPGVDRYRRRSSAPRMTHDQRHGRR